MDDIKVYASTSLVETSTGAIGDDLNAHKNDKNNPHKVTAADVGATPKNMLHMGVYHEVPEGFNLTSGTTAELFDACKVGITNIQRNYSCSSYSPDGTNGDWQIIIFKPLADETGKRFANAIAFKHDSDFWAYNRSTNQWSCYLNAGNIGNYAQPKITGTAGQFVVIGSDGNVTTKTINSAEGASF